MKNIKGKHCANCHNCRCTFEMAWCAMGRWFDDADYGMLKISIQNLSAKYYRDRAKDCPDYERDK